MLGENGVHEIRLGFQGETVKQSLNNGLGFFLFVFFGIVGLCILACLFYSFRSLDLLIVSSIL